MAPPRRRPLRGGPACRDPRSACHSCPTEHAHDHRSRCTRGEQGRDDVASQLLASGLRRSRAGAVVCSSVRQRPVAAADWTAFTLFVPVPHHATAHASQLLDPDRMGGAGPNWWVVQGYAVVNCDLRGAGTSDGVGRDSPTPLSQTSPGVNSSANQSTDFSESPPSGGAERAFTLGVNRKFPLGGDSAKDPRGSLRRRCMSQHALRSELSPLRSRTAVSGTPLASVSDLRRGPELVHAYPRLLSKGILFGERDVKMPAPLFRLILSDIRELITRF
jgi:hypothetical protein